MPFSAGVDRVFQEPDTCHVESFRQAPPLQDGTDRSGKTVVRGALSRVPGKEPADRQADPADGLDFHSDGVYLCRHERRADPHSRRLGAVIIQTGEISRGDRPVLRRPIS